MKRLKDVRRMGYGAMQLSGPGIMGPPADPAEARRVLLRALELGVDHIDTSDFYGPHVTNDLIREALHPYSDDLCLVTKVGARRDEQGGWPSAFGPEEIRVAVEQNLQRLDTPVLSAVNLRLPDDWTDSIEPQVEVLAELQQQGALLDIGLSNVGAERVPEAQRVAPVACVQNPYNLSLRTDDQLVDDLAGQDIRYVPFFPLGGAFVPMDFTAAEQVAAQHDGVSARQVALAWLLQRSPAILLIPGTSSVAHLEENLAAADVVLTEADVALLEGRG